MLQLYTALLMMTDGVPDSFVSRLVCLMAPAAAKARALSCVHETLLTPSFSTREWEISQQVCHDEFVYRGGLEA